MTRLRNISGDSGAKRQVEGMTEDEEDFKAQILRFWQHVARFFKTAPQAFLSIQGEQDAERAFGLASRHIASAAPGSETLREPLQKPKTLNGNPSTRNFLEPPPPLD